MSTFLEDLQALSPHPAVVIVLTLAVLALVVYEPLAGRRSYRAFLHAEEREGGRARLRFYRLWIIQGVATASAAVLLVVALPGIGPADLGLRLPHPSEDWFSGHGYLGGMMIGMLVGAVVGTIVYLLVRRRPGYRSPTQLDTISPMLPRTRTERRAWAALSLSAGVTEEITYRGLVLLTLAIVLPTGTHAMVLILLAGVLFGAAHLYQGRTGMVMTGLLGAILAALYLATESLLLVMVLHVLIDLRVLLEPVPSSPKTLTDPTA